MNKRQMAASVLHKSGVTWLFDRLWGAQRLTVLGYHRICDPTAPGFDGYTPNVSATPAMFTRQLDFVKARFNVIDLAALHRHITQGAPLPPRPLLITFDDGYLDNYANAYPLLRERGLPAVFFLVPEWVGTAYRPWWDRCAVLFERTAHTRATLPLVGECDLSTPTARRQSREAVMRQLKTVPERDKVEHMAALEQLLGVPLPEQAAPQFLTWDHAREMIANGCDCQPHTLNHPILTRVPLDEAQRQLRDSAARIVAETGQPTLGVAYPNGTLHDYNPAIMQSLRDLGIPLAFTLVPGPLRLRTLSQHTLEIPRAFLMHRDSFEMFVAKIMGFAALSEPRQFYGPPAATQ